MAKEIQDEEKVTEESGAEQKEETGQQKTEEPAEEPATEQSGEQPAEPEKEAGAETTEQTPAKKKKKGDKKTEALQTRIEELEDRVKRQMAEFDNFRKRTEKEKSTMFDMGARTVVEKFLPIIDNLERGLQAKPAEEVTPFTEGIEKVYKQLETVLEGMDVKPIEAVGHEFDPALLNAIMQDEEADVPENTVVEEFQKGYTYKGTVIRYSMVKVRK